MPFPSSGCKTCKIRKIKCDEAKPVCRRCIKSRRICHGARTGQACYEVHNENSYASGRKKRPRGPRSMPKKELMTRIDANVQRPLVDLGTHALVYYFCYHVRPLNDNTKISRGINDDCLSIWKSRDEYPILDLAVSSIALAVFARTHQHPPAAIQASMKYQQLLQTTYSKILSLDEGNIDAYLMAIFFMSRYEDAVHCLSPGQMKLQTPLTETIQSFSHHDGALAVLRIWKDHLSQSLPATDVIKHTRRGMIRSALLRHHAVPEWLADGASFGEGGLERDYDRLIVRITIVRRRLSVLLNKKTGSQRMCHELLSRTEELNKEAREIDDALQDWRTRLAHTRNYQRHTLLTTQTRLTRDFYSLVVHSYSSPAYAAAWNQYYSARMLINNTRAKILSLTDTESEDWAYEQRLGCLSHIAHMANDLASSIPFCLQRFETNGSPTSSDDQNSIIFNTTEEVKPYMASMVIWPLTVASSLEGLDINQKWWFKSVLARLGRVGGSGILECAETDQWLEL